MTDNPDSHILDLHTIVSIDTRGLVSDEGWYGEPILGDDGKPLTEEQAREREALEVRAIAKQHALERAAVQLADIASRRGLVVEETEPVEEGDEINFQFRMTVVPDKYKLGELLREEFNRAIDAAAIEVLQNMPWGTTLDEAACHDLTLAARRVESLKK